MSVNPENPPHRSFPYGPVTLGIILLLVGVGTQLRAKAPLVQPLLPARCVVVLLVPGAALSDWQDTEAMPIFAARLKGNVNLQGNHGAWDHGAIGVFPNRLPWRIGEAKLTALNPATSADFVRACRQLGGENLASTLHRDGIRLKPLGVDPAARSFLGFVTPSTLAYDNADVETEWRTNQSESVGGFVTDPIRFAGAICREAVKPAGNPLLVTATFDDLLRVDIYAPLSRSVAAAAQRHVALRRLDKVLARLTGTGPDSLPPDTALLILTPVPSMTAAERGELLGPVLLWQRPRSPLLSAPGFLLTSASTRQTPGLIASTDIAATILPLLGIAERGTEGRAAAILETADTPSLEAESLAARVARWSAQAREIRLLVTLPWLLAGTLLFAALFGRGKVRSICALGACASPVTLILAAPLASPRPGEEIRVYAVAALMTLMASILSALITGRWGKNGATALLRFLFLITAAAVLFDTLTGGTLLARSPLSYSPVSAARFYGIGNEISGVFLGASLLVVGVLGPTPLCAVLGGAIVCLVSGLPMFGADAGGFLSTLLSFGTLFVLLAVARSENKRRTRLMAVAGAGGAVLLLLVLYIVGNGRQPAGTRSHVGEAVASAQSAGGARTLLPLIQRKAATGVRLLLTSPWSILLVTETGICLWLWRRRPETGDTSEAVYQAVFTAATALFLLNDSGVVAAATCLLYPVSSLLLAEPPVSPPNAAEVDAAND